MVPPTNTTTHATFSIHPTEVPGPLAKLITGVIAALGDTPKQIATRLFDARVTGTRGDATCCPIAMHMRRTIPGLDMIAVFGDDIEVTTVTGEALTLALPEQVTEFICQFDAGTYPLLQPRRGRTPTGEPGHGGSLDSHTSPVVVVDSRDGGDFSSLVGFVQGAPVADPGTTGVTEGTL